MGTSRAPLPRGATRLKLSEACYSERTSGGMPPLVRIVAHVGVRDMQDLVGGIDELGCNISLIAHINPCIYIRSSRRVTIVIIVTDILYVLFSHDHPPPAIACGFPHNNSRMARLTTTSSAMAHKANSRDHAVICLIHAWAKPSHHFVSRKPASQPGRWAYSATACSAL